MELRAGDARQVVVMASPEEIRAAMAAADDAAAAPRSIVTETQRRRIVDTYRARHFLAHRSVADSLRHTRRSEMLRETQRLQEEIRALQEQIESTTRSVESMERLAFCLEQLTRDFEPSDRRDGVRVLHESVVTQNLPPSQDLNLNAMVLDRTRRRRQRALRVIRSPTRQEHQQFLSETPQLQPVIVLQTAVPAEPQDQIVGPSPSPAPPPSASLATTQRLLLAHAQRARHLLSHRSAIEGLSPSRRQEMQEEIEEMKRTMRTLQSQLEVTSRNVETMERLALHLQRITNGLREPRDDAPQSTPSLPSDPLQVHRPE
ncbi:hypothetical protein PRIC2_004778 [Phytophthora ramorum]